MRWKLSRYNFIATQIAEIDAETFDGVKDILKSKEEIAGAAVSAEDILIACGFSDSGAVARYSPDSDGNIYIAVNEMDRIGIRLFPEAEESKKERSYSGFFQVVDSFRPLPFGSTLDTKDGVFCWLIHPVFHGGYQLVFTMNEAGKPVAKKTIRIAIGERGKDLKGLLETYLSGISSSPVGISSIQASNNSPSYAQLIAQANLAVKRSSKSAKAGGDAISGTGVPGGRRSPELVSLESLVNTYYFYSYDGKLLAEYDHTGNCVRDYFYFGNTLLAEYLPQEAKYYYHTSDQVNSVRMVTDDSGTAVYSAAYAPYGQVHHTWVNTYQPKLQFSGKEREADTGLDYFGARYHANGQYRFISVDPIINKEGAISNPQLWNLYAYCRNNPITFLDPDGADEINIFFGFGDNDRGVDNFGKYLNFPDFGDLSGLASKFGHTVNIEPYSLGEFKKSLQAKDTWTFVIGHSLRRVSDSSYSGISFGKDAHFIAHEISLNQFVAIFSCQSTDFAFNLISGPRIFAVDSKGNGTSAYALANGAYSLLGYLIKNMSPEQAAIYATKFMRYNSMNQRDRNDSIVVK